MNLEKINQELSRLLVERKEFVGFFVYSGQYLWILDWDEHFNLDYMKNIDAVCRDKELLKYLPKNKTIIEYKDDVVRRYRDGITSLTVDLFPRYRDGNSAKVVTTELLNQEFFSEDHGQYAELSVTMEKELSFNTPMPEELVQLRSRLFSKLPKFYVNYDRKIFMHMVRGRSYEAVVLDGWWGAQGDFEHMIPTSHRYWARNQNEDFWAVTNFSNF